MKEDKGYLSIEDHGVVGNMHTVALIGSDGRVDFMCYPEFDSPSIFASILDKEKGGEFSIRPAADNVRSKQMYYPNTNILLTRFMKTGILEITDFMPIHKGRPVKALVRRMKSLKGKTTIAYRLSPRFAYGKTTPSLKEEEDVLVFRGDHAKDCQACLKVYSNRALDHRDGVIEGELTINEGEDVFIALLDPDCQEVDSLDAKKIEELFHETREFWNQWCKQCNYHGRWREHVLRSALALKLLLPYEGGNLIAAPTFGLPEKIGGNRNWDYRYTWTRDTTFAFYALANLGFTEEAKDFIHWINEHCNSFQKDTQEKNGPLEIMYNKRGDVEGLDETVLDHLEGHKRSAPVRIGNAAYTHTQLDIYGEYMDMLYQVDEKVEQVNYEVWQNVHQLLEWLKDNWNSPDQGIWEIRSAPRVHLSSLLMSWVAFDRAILIAVRRSLPGNIERWRSIRDEIYRVIHEDFYNSEINSFVQYKGTKVVDASLLLMTIQRFISFTDPKWLSTLSRIEEELTHDTLVQRYNLNDKDMDDGIGSEEGYLVVCSFWFIENLAKAGREEEARLLFEKMFTHTNHLGLLSEELSLKGELLGNFPQALSHLGLINTAINLDKAIEKGRRTKTPAKTRLA